MTRSRPGRDGFGVPKAAVGAGFASDVLDADGELCGDTCADVGTPETAFA